MMLPIFAWLLVTATTEPVLPTSSETEAPAPDAAREEASTKLASSLQGAIDDSVFGGLLRMSLDFSGDDAFQVAGEDPTGVRFEDAQLWVNTHAGPFEVFVLGKAADASAWPPLSEAGIGPLEIRDAWVRTELAEGVDLYAGQFKCPLVGSAMVGYDSLIMIDRTRIGQLFSAPGAYQRGVGVTYDNEDFHGKFVVQNGADGIIDEVGMVVRGELKVNGGARHREGALDAPTDLAATFGVGYFSDGSQIGGEDFGSAVAVDAYLTLDALSLHAEILDMDEELATKALGNAEDEGTPYSITLGYRFADTRWEAALRYQDMDDDLETTQIGVGLNYYEAGHPIKYQFNVSEFDNDDVDGMLVQLGLTVGIGAPNAGCATCRSGS